MPEHKYGPLVDIWSLGVVMLSCLLHEPIPVTRGVTHGPLLVRQIIECAKKQNHDALTQRRITKDLEDVLRSELFRFI